MATVDEFAGNWTYRSFYNKPEYDAKADDLLLAIADLTLKTQDVGGDCSEISGRLTMHNGFSVYLNVSGTAERCEPPTIQFRATGAEGTPTDGWIYDYIGYLTPWWPEGIGQRPAIVGTVIRTAAHKVLGGELMRPAGETLSFIAVSRDHSAA